jgi:hypothetical protein
LSRDGDHRKTKLQSARLHSDSFAVSRLSRIRFYSLKKAIVASTEAAIVGTRCRRGIDTSNVILVQKSLRDSSWFMCRREIHGRNFAQAAELDSHADPLLRIFTSVIRGISQLAKCHDRKPA